MGFDELPETLKKQEYSEITETESPRTQDIQCHESLLHSSAHPKTFFCQKPLICVSVRSGCELVSWNLTKQHRPWRWAAHHTARPSVARCAAQHADTYIFSRKKDPLLMQQTSSHQNPAKKSSCLSKRRENRSAAISVPLPQTAAPRGWRRGRLGDAAFELHTAASLTKNSCCKAPQSYKQ